ncbi:hypothetical protein GGX14DRAFT_398791 [Mycena pura]|uniref:Uncharacterized protein n=1 Tax=Mycena pura TaxID=153505 RepID=A0AAD6YBA8_9AGAR|nr:hypothetical protein GGX14DRAFT_398791 [Mycena pura]
MTELGGYMKGKNPDVTQTVLPYFGTTTIIEVEKNWAQLETENWFVSVLELMEEEKTDALGEKSALAAHLRSCKHSTVAERKLAAEVSPTKKEQAEKAKEDSAAKRMRREGDEDLADDEGSATGPRRRKTVKAVEGVFTQSKLKVFKGVDLPFTREQKIAIEQQTLRATQSANLPERWTDDPEVLKLLMMLRSRAGEVVPGRAVLGCRARGHCDRGLNQNSRSPPYPLGSHQNVS